MKIGLACAVLSLAAGIFPAPASALLLPAVQKMREAASRMRSGQVYAVDLTMPILVGPGDTLDLTLTFGDDSTLMLSGFRRGGVRVAPGDVTGVVSLETANTLEFLDGTGPLVSPTAPRTWTGGPGDLGGVFEAADFLSGPGPVSFSGLRLRSGVIAEVGAGRPATVGRVFFWFEGTNLGFVPEPGTWALMLIGLGLSGAALRRQTTSMKLSSTRF